MAMPVRARQVANQIALRDAIDKYGVKQVVHLPQHGDSPPPPFVADGSEGISAALACEEFETPSMSMARCRLPAANVKCATSARQPAPSCPMPAASPKAWTFPPWTWSRSFHRGAAAWTSCKPPAAPCAARREKPLAMCLCRFTSNRLLAKPSSSRHPLGLR